MTKHRAKPHSKAKTPEKQPPKAPPPGSSSKQAQKSSAKKPPRERGALLTIAIIFVFLHGVLWTGLSYAVRQEGDSNFPVLMGLLLLASAATVVAGLGMWLWKRWGITVYFVASMIIAAVSLLMTGSFLMFFGSFMQAVIILYIVHTKQHLFE